MIRSVIVDNDKEDLDCLEKMLFEHFPDIRVCGKTDTAEAATIMIAESQPELLFLNYELHLKDGRPLNDCFLGSNYQVILLAGTESNLLNSATCRICGQLIKPLQQKAFVLAVSKAVSRIYERQENLRNKSIAEKYFRQTGNEDIIGIPTIEGFTFISVRDIITCEGLQKCTRVITKEKTDIISSYNLGEFRKFLEPYGFFSPHKSHLINMMYIKNYHREGSILLTNGISVPVAKRKKKEFLDRIKHL